MAGFRARLTPGPVDRVLAAVSVTLAMWFDKDFDAPLDLAVLEAWCADLRDMPAWAIEDACGMWRRAHNKRPVPADIRDLALRETEHDREMLRRLELTVMLSGDTK